MSPTRRLSISHRVWFVSTLVAYLLFMVLMPPFQTNDEPSHWNRVWSVASGHLTCAQIPSSSRDLVDALNYGNVRDGHPYRLGNLDRALLLQGHPKKIIATGNACVYIPVAYLLPALAMVPWVSPYDPRDASGMLTAYYAARLTNLMLMSGAVLMFLFLAPALRNLTLLLYSLPMTMQQATVINQESTIFLCGFALLLLWWARSTLWQVLLMLLFITLLAMMKSIYLVLLLLFGCALWRLRQSDPKRWSYLKLGAVAALALIPLVIQMLWTKLVVSVSSADYVPGWGVSPSGQVDFLKHHPLHLFVVLWHQFLDLFGHGHMNGGWTSVFGVLGWAEIEIGDGTYRWLLLATLIAAFADLRSVGDSREFGGVSLGGWRGLVVERVLPIVSFLLIVPAVTMAMYIVFSQVGSPYAMGVQGRYLQLPYFAALALGIMWLRSVPAVRERLARLPRLFDASMLAWVCMALSWVGTRAAFRAVLLKYYQAPILSELIKR